MAFKLTKYSYKSLRQLSVQDRLQVAQDREMGQWLLSLLTPSQFVDLFPRYYRESMPDISGFAKAMPSSMTAAKQRAAEEQLSNTVSGAAAGSNYKAGGWKRKYQEGLDNQRRASVSKAGVVPPPQLSPEQRKAFDDLKSAPMTADDPRAKMFAGLSAEQMAKVGISKVKENGKDVFKYTSKTFTEEEVKKEIAMGSSSSQMEALKREISRGEGDYGAYNRGVAGDTPKSSRTHDLTNLTVGQIMQMQSGGKGNREFFAVGKYQFIPDTLRAAVRYTGMDPNTKFDAAAQEKLFTYLISAEKRPNLKAYLTGKSKNVDAALNDLALEFASIPDNSGRGKYSSAGNAAMGGIGRAERIKELLAGAQKTYNDPITQDYSQKSMDLARERLGRRSEEERIGSLAAYTTAQVGTSGAEISSTVASGASTGSWLGESKQCVALSKHFAPGIGPASSWNVQNNSEGIVPGAVIATMSYNDHSGGKMAKDMPDKKSHYHTGIALTKPDGQGNVLILDQHAGRGSSITRVNINDHNGEKWGPVAGGGPSESSLRAIELAKNLASPEQKALIDGRGQSLGVTAAQVAAPAEKTVKDSATSKATPQVQDPSPPVPRAGPQGDTSIPQVETPKVTNKPAEPTPERYRVDTAKFINAIKATPEFKSQAGFFAGMVPDSTIINGFNDDPRVKAAGVHLDEKGVMHFKRGMTGDVKQVMADFDTKSFMTKIEDEKKKTEVKPVEQKPVEKPASERPPVSTPANPAPQVETPKVTNKPAEPPKGAPATVKTNAMGGVNKINTEEISAYPIGGLNGDNAVVVNKQQKPLFTMNTNEAMTIDPKNDTAIVTPNARERNVGATQSSPLESMFSDFTQSVRNLSDKFDTNKSTTEPAQKPDPFPAEGGSWLNNLNKLTEQSFHSPSSRRAFYRSQGQSVDNGTGTNHFSHGNNS